MGKVVILNDDEISKRKILPYRIKPKDELEEKMELKEYYFVKCFTAKKYRDDFNNGVDIHINNNRQFWKKENTFQQDYEGMIFKQNKFGSLIIAKQGCGDIVDNIIKNSLNSSYNSVMEELEEYVYSMETKDFSISVDGYICCFYLLPKSEIEFDIENMTFGFSDETKQGSFINYIHEYALENKKHEHKSYVSIYDAYAFMYFFSKGLESQGYSITYDKISYSDVTVSQKIQALKTLDYKTLLFTKPTKYSYQNEFRIFVSQKNNEELKNFLSVNGIDLNQSVVATFSYSANEKL